MKFSSDKHNRDAHSIAQLVEAKLIDLENFFHEVNLHKGVNISVENDLTVEEEKEVKQMIQNIYELLKTFSERYEIKPIKLSLKKEIGFNAVLLWQEIAGTRLDASGDLDKALKDEFENYVARMTEMVDRLSCSANKIKVIKQKFVYALINSTALIHLIRRWTSP